MRRPALLALLLLPSSTLLASCTGIGTFLDHTFTLPGSNPDLPQADAENVRRSLGQPAPVAPLSPEPGDVWPPPAAPAPTLGQVEKSPALQDQFAPTTVPGERPGLPAGHEPVPIGRPTEPPPALPNLGSPRRRGSSTPPGSVEPPLEPGLPPDALTQPPSRPSQNAPALPSTGGAVQLPNGVGVDAGGTSGYRQLTLPNGQPGAIIVPNGNGTSTVIQPNGTVQTIPTPK